MRQLLARWPALALLALLALIGVGILLRRDGAGESAPAPGMRQTVDGYTMTLLPYYADANRVVLSATVSGPLFENYPLSFVNWDNSQPHLTDDQGHVFPWLDGWMGTQLIGRGRERALPPARQTSLHIYADHELALTFDTSALQDTPAVLHLHLTTDIGSFGEAPFKVAGPFTFDFQLPFEAARRVAPVRQTVVGPRGHLTLEQVIVSQREVRAFLHFEAPDAVLNMPFTIQPLTQQDIQLDVGSGKTLPAVPVVSGINWAATQWTYSRYASLLDSGPDWILTVPEVQQAGASWRDVQGPWTFHFQVPPAGATPVPVTPVVVYGSPTLLPPSPSPVQPLASPVQTAWPTLPPPVPSVLPKRP